MHRRLALRQRAQSMKGPADGTPLEVSVERRPQSLREQLQAYVREQVSLAAQAQGDGSFEDEDDFDEEDDNETWFSPHELLPMQEEAPIDAPHSETLDGTDDSPPPQATPPEPVETSPEPSGNADSL